CGELGVRHGDDLGGVLVLERGETEEEEPADDDEDDDPAPARPLRLLRRVGEALRAPRRRRRLVAATALVGGHPPALVRLARAVTLTHDDPFRGDVSSTLGRGGPAWRAEPDRPERDVGGATYR